MINIAPVHQDALAYDSTGSAVCDLGGWLWRAVDLLVLGC
jgi:hypothetical protein